MAVNIITQSFKVYRGDSGAEALLVNLSQWGLLWYFYSFSGNRILALHSGQPEDWYFSARLDLGESLTIGKRWGFRFRFLQTFPYGNNNFKLKCQLILHFYGGSTLTDTYIGWLDHINGLKLTHLIAPFYPNCRSIEFRISCEELNWSDLGPFFSGFKLEFVSQDNQGNITVEKVFPEDGENWYFGVIAESAQDSSKIYRVSKKDWLNNSYLASCNINVSGGQGTVSLQSYLFYWNHINHGYRIDYSAGLVVEGLPEGVSKVLSGEGGPNGFVILNDTTREKGFCLFNLTLQLGNVPLDLQNAYITIKTPPNQAPVLEYNLEADLHFIHKDFNISLNPPLVLGNPGENFAVTVQLVNVVGDLSGDTIEYNWLDGAGIIENNQGSCNANELNGKVFTGHFPQGPPNFSLTLELHLVGTNVVRTNSLYFSVNQPSPVDFPFDFKFEK